MNWPVVALPLTLMSRSPSSTAGQPPSVGPAGPAGHERSLSDLGITQRSMRYHRPRAPFCGVGYCTNCIVRTPERLNQRACLDGFATPNAVASANGWPSTRFDLGVVVDLLFPRGIDTLHGFRRPAWAVPLYQRIVRGLSGYGRPPERTARPADPPSPLLHEDDVAVIGMGVSGTAVVEELGQRGVDSVCVLDRMGVRVPRSPPSELSPTTAIFLPPPQPSEERPFTILASRHDGRAVLVRSRRVVVATGGYDASLLFAGNDRPGIMTADGAFAFAAARVKPFHRALVFGDGPRAMAVLERFDEQVAGVVAPGEIGPDLTRAASDRGIPLYPRSLLLQANGRRWVRSVSLRARGGGERSTLPCDAVVLAHRRVPHPQLFFQAGATMRWSSSTAAYYPAIDAAGATSVPGLYAVGEAQGPLDPANARASGQAAAKAIASAEPPGPEVEYDPAELPPHPLEGYYRELLQHHDGLTKWVACPCEDILLTEVEHANHRGFRGIEVIKRYTGLGTGLCQGRYCLPDALIVLSILEGRAPSEVGFITQRPPVVPTSLRTLASTSDLLAPKEGG